MGLKRLILFNLLVFNLCLAQTEIVQFDPKAATEARNVISQSNSTDEGTESEEVRQEQVETTVEEVEADETLTTRTNHALSN